MPIEYIQGSIENVSQIYDCCERAFSDDLMNKAMFPVDGLSVEDLEKYRKFRVQRLAKRLLKPGCHIFIAIDKEVENGNRTLGCAVWYEEPIFESAEEEKKPEDKVEDISDIPKSINIKLAKRVEEMAGGVRDEYLKGMEGNLWYLRSLAVDPEFGGRGIASTLVRKGIDQAQKANLPAYTESTPAAVRVYANQGFKELGRKAGLENYYWTIMLRMPDTSSSLQAPK